MGGLHVDVDAGIPEKRTSGNLVICGRIDPDKADAECRFGHKTSSSAEGRKTPEVLGG